MNIFMSKFDTRTGGAPVLLMSTIDLKPREMRFMDDNLYTSSIGVGRLFSSYPVNDALRPADFGPSLSGLHLDCDGDSAVAYVTYRDAAGSVIDVPSVFRVCDRASLDFNEPRPVAVINADTNRVLMIAYTLPETIRLSTSTGEAHFWSTSRGKVWRKGEESGNVMRILRIESDPHCQTFIYYITGFDGVACHTGARSCFFRALPRIWMEHPDPQKLGEKERLLVANCAVHSNLIPDD